MNSVYDVGVRLRLHVPECYTREAVMSTPSDTLGNLSTLHTAITICLADVRVARDYGATVAERQELERLDALLDLLPRKGCP